VPHGYHSILARSAFREELTWILESHFYRTGTLEPRRCVGALLGVRVVEVVLSVEIILGFVISVTKELVVTALIILCEYGFLPLFELPPYLLFTLLLGSMCFLLMLLFVHLVDLFFR
jgi:hypothetical protein